MTCAHPETHSERERADRRQQRAERRRPRREARLGEQRGEGARARGRAQHSGDMGVFIIRMKTPQRFNLSVRSSTDDRHVPVRSLTVWRNALAHGWFSLDDRHVPQSY